MQLTIRHILIFCLMWGSLLQAHQDAPADQELFFDAKRKVMAEDYQAAIDELEQLVSDFPKSRYVDDAKFWIGFCLEKMPERQSDAYEAFTLLVNTYPTSSWVDDAVAHQIMLAEHFVRNGQEEYREVLEEQLGNSDEDVHYQAAISLGKLGDQVALPALREMQNMERWRSTAAELLRNFDTDASVQSNENYSIFGPSMTDLEISDPLAEESTAGIDLLTIQPERYRYYRNMLKAESGWGNEELADFGLWHILDIEQFADYYQLTARYDRREWLRKFWKENDPTPTTEKNELKDEFDRRVVYANRHFAETVNKNDKQYLEDQYLIGGVRRAPWDSRGELYVKFGSPDHRGVLALGRERWNYGRYQITFIVKKHITNIYGNGLKGNSLLARLGPAYDQSDYVSTNFIDREQFHFVAEYQQRLVEGFEVQTALTGGASTEVRLQVPLGEFQPERRNDRYVRKLRYTIVAHDEDMNEVRRISEVVELESSSRGKKVPVTALLSLPQGEYQIGARIEDPVTRQLGIARTELVVE